jgi:hypothetical protein
MSQMNTPAAPAFARAIRDQQGKVVYAPAKTHPMKTDRRFFKELRFRQLRALVELSRQKTFSALAAELIG